MYTETTQILKKVNPEKWKKAKNVTIKVSNSNRLKINDCIKNNIPYAVFPIAGESMTCSDPKLSVPHGSKVLVIDSQIDITKGLANIWHEIPLKKTLLIVGQTGSGKEFFICKTFGFLDVPNDCINLVSYNPEFRDQLVPFSWIKKIFKFVEIVDIQ
jgi:hypothetical protein